MSVKLMALAFELPIQPSEKLVMLALCDHANDEGGSCHPTIDKIASKASVSDRTVRRILAKLVEIGLISLVKSGGGRNGNYGISNHYQIDIEKLRKGDIALAQQTESTTNTDCENSYPDNLTSYDFTKNYPEIESYPDTSGMPTLTNDASYPDKLCPTNHHITTNKPSSGSFEFMDRAQEFLKNDGELKEPPLSLFENDDLPNDQFAAESPAQPQPTEPAVGIVKPKPTIRDKAFEIVEYFHQKNYEIFLSPAPTDYPLVAELEMVIAWLERGYTQVFCENVILGRLGERKRKQQTAIGGKWWAYFDKFIEEKWQEAKSKKSAAAAKIDDDAPYVAPQIAPESEQIQFSNPQLRKHLDCDLNLPQNAWLPHCRAEMEKLLQAEWWVQTMQAMERKFGAGVMEAWFNQTAPVYCQPQGKDDAYLVIIFCKKKVVKKQMEEQYIYHLQETLNHFGINSPRIEFTN
jgi:predicted transcriptional regulator